MWRDYSRTTEPSFSFVRAIVAPAFVVKIALVQELLYSSANKERGIDEQTDSPGLDRGRRCDRGSRVVPAGAAACSRFSGETLFRYAARKRPIADRAPTVR